MKNKILLNFLLLFAVFGRMSAQNLQACAAGANITSTCKASCINCDLDGVTGATNSTPPITAPPSICLGALVLDRPAWMGFIAGSTDLSLRIESSNCTGTGGLEFAVMQDCNTTVLCAAGPNPQSGPNQYVLNVSNLVVSQPYQLVIDGYNGAVCNFKITTLSGSAAAPALGAVGAVEGPAQVCPNAVATYSIPPVSGAVSYFWSAPAGTSINGGLNTALLPATGNNNSVEVAFQNTGGTVCVTASNACSAPVTVCKSISNVPIPPTQLPPLTICYNELPYSWDQEPFTTVGAAGTFNLTSSAYSSHLGCDSVVKQTIHVLPRNIKNLPLKYLCKDECFYINGFEFCESGSFQETLVAENGCDSLVTFTLIKVPAKAVVNQADTLTCLVTSVALTGAGSTSGNTILYDWIDPDGQNISHTLTANATKPGLHMFIVTNNQGGIGCKDTAYVNVPSNYTAPQVNAGPDKDITCLVSQVQLEGSGSAGSLYTYFWKAQLGGNIVSGATTLNPIVNAPGTYTLRVTNTHTGCTAISNAVVHSLLAPPVITTAGGTFTCTNPVITLQASTNAATATYQWTGPNGFNSTLQNPTTNVPGTYNLTVTNAYTGCTNTAFAVVNAGNNPPDLVVTGGGITCVSNTITLDAASSISGVTYAWTGPGGFTSTVRNPVVTTLGTYQVVVTAPNGCTNSGTAVAGYNNTPPGTELAATGSLNCNNTTVNVLATSVGNPGNLTHAWTLPNGTTQNTGPVAFLPVNVAGVYSVVVNNTATGCVSTASFTVVHHDNVTASVEQTQNAKCSDSNDGTLTAQPTGGSGVFTYAWSNAASGQANVNLGPGSYVVTVTDNEGCSATASGTVGAPPAINTNATATAQTANGVSDGTASVNPTGGTPGYTYVWSNAETTQTIEGLAPGSYTVTVTDGNGCTAVKTVNVSQFDCTLQTDLVSTNSTCPDSDNGSATINILGGATPFVINWSTGDTTATISSLAPGQYSVSVTDGNNCPEVQTFTITEPQTLLANASGSTTTGVGISNGTATASPTGGTGTYTYLWSTAAITASITDLAAATYTVTVTDENGCTVAQTVEVVPGNCNLTTNLQLTNLACNGGTDGAATIVLTGGAGGFTFLWSTGGTTATETGLNAGPHTVTVTDVNGCSIIVPVAIPQPPAIVGVVEATTQTDCPTSPAGTATISVSGGTGALSVLWPNGQTTLSATELTAGTFAVVITDETGCTGTVSVTITSNDTEAPVINSVDTNVSIGPDGTVFLTPQMMSGEITDNCSLASVTFEPAEFNCLQRGPHEVTITATDNVGLSTTKTITITIVDTEKPTLICSPSLVLCFENNVVNYQAPTASDNCFAGGVFNVVEGLAIGATFPLGSTITTYSYTDSSGNVGTCSFEVTILPQLVVTVDTIINDVNLLGVGSVFLNVSGSLAPYSYVWKFNGQQIATVQNITGLTAGNYTVEVTDDNGCTRSLEVSVKNTTSGTKTPTNLDAIRVFPNPTSGNLIVSLPDELIGHDAFLQMFDLTGRRVMTQASVQDKQIDLQMYDLADGVYTLIVRIDDRQIVRKIVLSK